jgi:hypothetical protein
VIVMEPDEDGVRDADGVGFDSPRDLLIESKAGGLGWCGCGDVDDAIALVRTYLQALYEGQQQGRGWGPDLREQTGIPVEAWCLLQFLCDGAGWTEHGGSVLGAWLTEEGRQALWLLTEGS